MKHRNYFAALAALMMLTAAACGAKNESAELTNSDAPLFAAEDADGFAEEAAAGAEAAGKSDGEAAAPAAADDADVPAIYADREAMADAGFASSKSAAAGLEGAAVGGAVDGAAYEAPDGDPVGEPIDDLLPEEPVNRPEAGVLTAGEWRDHENWGFFSNLVKTEAISFPSFGLDPCHRVSVKLTDAAGSPLANAQVTLLDADGKALWKAKTGKDGIAYLFEANGAHGTSVTASLNGAEGNAAVPASTDGTQGGAAACTDRAVSLQLDAAAAPLSKTQVMFIVDTTGSMSDEMLYLQSDFAAIAGEVGDAGTQYGALFYKDEGDTYVTRYQGFTSDVGEIRKQLNSEVADGGGDEPEAVAEAFTEAFVREGWEDDAVKVAFLIYDAPPHTDRETELQTAVEAASEKGIHLVPVVSSNGSRETELFGRACAICTNGSYVFLTDDSGVGGSHLEPIIGDYEVEKLHDIIVRIIQDYKQ